MPRRSTGSNNRTRMATIRHSSRPRSRSPLLYDGSLSRAEVEQRDYELAKELQEQENRLQWQEERTLEAGEIEDRTNSRYWLRSCNHFVPQRQPSSDQEGSHDFSFVSEEDEESGADDSDSYDASEIESDESALEVQSRSDGEVSDESEVHGEEESAGDVELPDEGDHMDSDRSHSFLSVIGGGTSDSNSQIELPLADVVHNHSELMLEDEDNHSVSVIDLSIHEVFGIQPAIDRLLNLLRGVEQQRSLRAEATFEPDSLSHGRDADDVTEVDVESEPDDTVIRSADFGRCIICFEDMPYDPVGCLYCQQMIGCRRCVKRWYRGVRWMDNSEGDSMEQCTSSKHKHCPLCRHEWEEQMEVTSMFYIRDG